MPCVIWMKSVMQDTKISEVYALMSDGSWKYGEDGVSKRNEIGDIDILTWAYEDPACLK